MSAHKSALSSYLARTVLGLALGGALFVLLTAYITAEKSVRRSYTFRLVTGTEGPTTENLEKTRRILAERVAALSDDFGLIQPAVQSLPPDHVRVEFTTRWSASEPQQQHTLQEALAWIGMQGLTTFHLVHPTRGLLEAGEEPPAGCVRRLYRARLYQLSRPGNFRIVEHAYAVEREPVLTIPRFGGVDLETSGLHKLATVTFGFPAKAAEKFASVTSLNVGRELAMVVDDEMHLPPRTIEAPVTGGSVQIQGYFFLPPLRKLVKVLKTGAVPHPLEMIETSESE